MTVEWRPFGSSASMKRMAIFAFSSLYCMYTDLSFPISQQSNTVCFHHPSPTDGIRICDSFMHVLLLLFF